jgi:hypothetical protein
VVVLDLSSFKCGHDAPTYGLIDNILTSSRTPASALHDLDANKPAGSIGIRVRTYAHTLRRFEEALSDRAARRTELERRVDDKRRELLARWRAALGERDAGDPAARRQREEVDAAFRSYLEEESDSALAPADCGGMPPLLGAVARGTAPARFFRSRADLEMHS